jgi:hypothetical protein
VTGVRRADANEERTVAMRASREREVDSSVFDNNRLHQAGCAMAAVEVDPGDTDGEAPACVVESAEHGAPLGTLAPAKPYSNRSRSTPLTSGRSENKSANTPPAGAKPNVIDPPGEASPPPASRSKPTAAASSAPTAGENAPADGVQAGAGDPKGGSVGTDGGGKSTSGKPPPGTHDGEAGFVSQPGGTLVDTTATRRGNYK